MKASNTALVLRSRFPSLVNLLSARTTALVCCVFVACYLTARAGDILVLRPEMVLPFWPGCAVLIAVLLSTRATLWPILLLAGLSGFIAYDLQAGLALHSIVLFNIGDVVEILIAVFGLQLALKDKFHLNNVKALSTYLLIVVVLAPAAGAFIGPLSSTGAYWLAWRVSFLADALALLTVTPAILGWVNIARLHKREHPFNYVEAAGLTVGLIIVGFVTFETSTLNFFPGLLYSLVPFLLWSALRFGITGISTSMVFVAFLSIWSAVHGHGPFTGSDRLQDVLSLQLFLLFASTPFIFLATIAEQRRRVDQSLRESEQRFRLVANTAPVMIWMSGTDQLCNYLNQPWLNFTGNSLEAELKSGWAYGIHPDDFERCLKTFVQAFDRREEFRVEYRLRRYDGEYRWILDHGVPRFLADGAFAGYIGSAIDVTDVKKVQEELAETSRRFQLAMEAGGIEGWETDLATGRKVRFGRPVSLLGRSPDGNPWSAQDFWNQVHPSDRSRLQNAIEKARHNRTDFTEEFRVIWPDGTVHWLRSRGRYIYSSTGEAQRMLGIAVDVTKRRDAENALRENEERLRMAVQAGKMFAYSWDAVSDRVEISGETRHILGIDEDIVTSGKEIAERIHPDDREAVITAVGELSVIKPSLRITHRLMRADNTVIWVETNSQAFFDEQGSLTRIIGMTAEITERRQAEEIVSGLSRRLIEAQEADRTRIARDLHDDIGQQLVLLALEVGQLNSVLRTRGAEARERIANIQNQVSQISASVHGLSHQLHSSSLRNLGLTAAIRSYCREISEQQGVEIQFKGENIPEDIPEDVSLCLFRVLQEALQNAVKHSGVAHFDVELQGDTNSVQLTVSDLGAGFDPDAAMRGTGLGLVSMRERLKLVNGQLSVSSKPRGGTTICARVPLAQARGTTLAAG